MTDLVLVLCAAVVKTAFKLWSGDNILADNLSSDLTDMIKSRVSNALDQRKVRARFAQMEEIVADQLLTTLSSEFRGVDEGERNAAIIAVTETFDRAKLTDKVLFAGNLDPFYLEKYVRGFSAHSTRDLSLGGTALYERVLAQCCAYIIEIADKLPRFQAGAFAELLQRDSQILARLEDVLVRLPVPSEEATGPDRVETAYRQRIAKIFDRLELFGLDFAAQWYALSIAYVNLKVSIERSPERGGRAFENWLAEYPRLFIDGRAGSGKTTILQWIAVRAARRDFDGPAASLNGYIPYFIRLREYVGRALPAPEEFLDKIAPLLAPEARSWPRDQLRSGQSFVLVDGVDEIPETQRPAVLAWINELTELFPNVRYVVTARPGAIEQDSLREMGFRGAVLDPMEPVLIRAFVDQWHAAMREWQKDTESQDQLTAYRNELLNILQGDRFLSELANTPLLAGLICALNQHLNGQLPRRRGEIFEKALAMFYERDRQRGIVGSLSLDQAATYHVLSDLALWMVRNGAIEVKTDVAWRILQKSSASLPSKPQDMQELYRYLVLRSGLIREPTTDCVDFVHRTFQEYLAAKALIVTDNVGEIIKNAHDDQWREVVILSAGQANFKQTTELLKGLLNAGRRGKGRYTRRFLAIACLDEIHSADAEVLAAIEKAIPELLPPRSMDQAEALSHAGERLIPHLSKIRVYRDANELACAIRMAALMGGSNSFDFLTKIVSDKRELIREYHSKALQSELLRTWQYFDSEVYAEKVLAPLALTSVTVTDGRLFRDIPLLPTVRRVTLSGFVTEGSDLSPLDETGIWSLTMDQCNIHSLASLKNWPAVKYLEFSNCKQLKDISALPLLQHLEELAIIYCSEIKDYQPILQASRIKKLRFQGLRGIDLGFLENAPLELEEIWLSYMKRVDLRPLAGRSGLIIVADSVAEIIKPDKFYPKLRVTPSTKTRFILQN